MFDGSYVKCPYCDMAMAQWVLGDHLKTCIELLTGGIVVTTEFNKCERDCKGEASIAGLCPPCAEETIYQLRDEVARLKELKAAVLTVVERHYNKGGSK